MLDNDPVDTKYIFDFCLFPSIGEDDFFVRMTAFFSPDVTGDHSFWFKGNIYFDILQKDMAEKKKKTFLLLQ